MPDQPSDTVLVARLRALGYTTALPTIEEDTPEPEVAGAWYGQRLSGPEQARGPTLLQRMLATRQEEEGVGPAGGGPRPVTPPSPSDRPESIANLLQIVDSHRVAALAALKKSSKKGPSTSRGDPRGDQAPKSAASNVSPRKRTRRRTSSSSSASSSTSNNGSDSPSPPSPCPPQKGQRGQEEPISPTPTTQSRKKAAIRLAVLASLALGSPTAAKAAPPASPFIKTAQQVDELIPDLDLTSVVHLARSLERNRALLDLARVQTSQGGRRFGSNLNFLGDHIFSSSPLTPKSPAHATLRLARALDLDAPVGALAAAANETALPVLTTSRTTCTQCSAPLTLRRYPNEPVWLVRPAEPAEKVLVAIHVCTNRVCRGTYTPDHLEVSHRGRSAWLWDGEAAAYKVGERVWITREGAQHVCSLLLDQAVSPGGFAKTWNRLYAVGGSEAAVDTEDEASDIDEEDAPDPTTAAQTGSSRPKKKRARTEPFRLQPTHVWRAVVLVSCLDAARQSPLGRFASPVRPSTRTLVDLANAWLFSAVLPPHQCSACTRPRQRWLGGPATAAERRDGLRWAGTHARTGRQLVEDVEGVRGLPVQMAVCDGLEIGYLLCAALGCPNPPERHRRATRFCAAHAAWHDLCGIVSCGRPRSDRVSEVGLSEACDDPLHEELWLKTARRKEENRNRGWRGRANEPRRRVEKAQLDVRVAPDSSESDSSVDDDDDDDATVGTDGKRRGLQDAWSLRRTTNLQLLVAACGTPLAWTAFPDGETPAAVLDFLASVSDAYAGGGNTMPAYVAYDRACHLLRHVVDPAPNPDDTAAKPELKLPAWLERSRLVVDAFHSHGHRRDDVVCSTFCDPAPLDGETHPDLVIPLKETAGARTTTQQRQKQARTLSQQRHAQQAGKERPGPAPPPPARARQGGRVFERAFCTSAAEQLNSGLSRFAFLLAGLRAHNFTFLVHLLLRARADAPSSSRAGSHQGLR